MKNLVSFRCVCFGAFFGFVSASGSSYAASAKPKASPEATPKATSKVTSVATKPTYLRGVNIMDLGIAGTTLPGIYDRNYTRPSLQALRDLKGRGLDVVRISFLWERIQPRLDGPLDAAYLGYLMGVLRDADTANIKVIVDMHNYGRYTPTTSEGRTTYRFGDAKGPTQAQYAHAWTKIAAAINADAKAYRAVYAYDIMNEPYALPELPATLTKARPLTTFERNTDGWTTAAPLQLSRAVRDGKNVLQLTAPAAEGSGNVFGLSLPATAKNLTAENGTGLQLQGVVPATTPGIVRARMVMIDSAWKAHKTESISLIKGEPFVLDFAFAPAVWQGNRGIAIDFIVDQSDGGAPFMFQVDGLSQGQPAGAKNSAQVWEGYAQAAVSALRAAKDTTLVMVEGYDFSSSTKWPTNHPVAWIRDPLGRTMYQAHLYMDKDSSGTYKLSHADELALSKADGYASVGARTIARVKNFTDWAKANKVPGFIGEFGWPNLETVGKAQSDAWDQDAEELLTFLDGTRTGLTVWGTGSWLSPTDNILNAYQLTYGKERAFRPLSPGFVLEHHPSK